MIALVKNAADAEVRVLSEPVSKPPQSIPSFEEMKEPGQQGKETLRRVSNTVRVNINKLDHIMNIISELGILKIEHIRARGLSQERAGALGLRHRALKG